jgi:hypothetical protein
MHTSSTNWNTAASAYWSFIDYYDFELQGGARALFHLYGIGYSSELWE